MRAPAALLLALSLCTVGAGVAWMVQNFGTATGYGDALEYLRLARTLQVDEYRGAVYPALIAIVHAGTGDIEATVKALHAIQIVVSIACLGYFWRVVVEPTLLPAGWSERRRATAGAAVIALLLCDPLVAHFHLSVMTDALALAGSLAFCAALADLALRRSPPVVSAIVLIASLALTAGLRVEKSWAMLATTIAFVCAWWAVHARSGVAFPRGRAALAIGLVVSAVVVNEAAHRAIHRDHGRWSIGQTIAHHRIVFPHLEAIYDELPPDVRARLSRAQARRYDRRIHNTWLVVDRVTEDDPAARARLTEALLGPALRARWPHITASIAGAVVENTLAPFSFHVRLAAWAAGGADAAAWEERFEATPYTWHVLSRVSPRTSVVLVTSAGALLLVGTALCVRVGWTRRREPTSGGMAPDTVLAVAPTVAFVVANAFVFALIGDLVHIRYVLFAHLVGLLAVDLGALHAVLSIDRGEPHAVLSIDRGEPHAVLSPVDVDEPD